MAEDLLSLPTEDFLAGIEEVARTRFDCRVFPQRNMTVDDWAVLVGAGVMLPAIPAEFGGRDSHVEMCRVVETLAEWNLPVGMYTKIIAAVALRPIALHASEQAKREVLPLFAGADPMICGFASTEPGCGSAMSSMQTTFEKVDGGGERPEGRGAVDAERVGGGDGATVGHRAGHRRGVPDSIGRPRKGRWKGRRSLARGPQVSVVSSLSWLASCSLKRRSRCRVVSGNLGAWRASAALISL